MPYTERFRHPGNTGMALQELTEIYEEKPCIRTKGTVDAQIYDQYNAGYNVLGQDIAFLTEEKGTHITISGKGPDHSFNNTEESYLYALFRGRTSVALYFTLSGIVSLSTTRSGCNLQIPSNNREEEAATAMQDQNGKWHSFPRIVEGETVMPLFPLDDKGYCYANTKAIDYFMELIGPALGRFIDTYRMY